MTLTQHCDWLIASVLALSLRATSPTYPETTPLGSMALLSRAVPDQSHVGDWKPISANDVLLIRRLDAGIPRLV